MQKPTVSIGLRLAELEQRATAAENAVKELQERVSVLEGQPSSHQTNVVTIAKKKQEKIDYEDPPLRNYLIFAPKKSDKTLFIDYSKTNFIDYSLITSKESPVKVLERQLQEAGFKIIADESRASEIALVVPFYNERIGGAKEVILFEYLERHLNAFLVIWTRDSPAPLPKIFKKSEMKFPYYNFIADRVQGNPIPIGFFGEIPKPRMLSSIASEICTTCCSRHGNNTCNVCQEAFCGMECFAYGHKRCYQ